MINGYTREEIHSKDLYIKKKKFQQMIHDKTRFHITYILVESQRYLGILDTDHGMIKLVIPISIYAIRILKKGKGGDVTLKLAVSVVRGMVVIGSVR